MTDREDIHDVLTAVAHAIDSRDYESLRSLYAPNATIGGNVDTGRNDETVGIDAIVALARALHRGVGPTQHLQGNESITIDGDTAQVRCSVRAFHIGQGERSHLVYEALGDYHDVMVRTPEGWRILHRSFEPRLRTGPRNEVLGLTE